MCWPARMTRTAVRAFVNELLDEQLIDVVDAGEPTNRIEQATATRGARGGFTGLRLARYNDLEVMLLADPIHEVDDTGWPMPLADPPR
jgi:hypothetical protein